MAVPELQKFRERFPDYNDIGDAELAKKLASSYPEYADLPSRVASDVSSNQPKQKQQSFYDSPFARQVFPASGQMIGGFAAGALATPGSFGAATVPAAAMGGVGGGLAGESLRQFLASMQGGGPQNTSTQVGELMNTGQTAMLTEMVPPILGAVGKAGGFVGKSVAKFIYKNIPDPVMSWVKTRASQGVDILNYSKEAIRDNLGASITRLGEAMKTIRQQPELLQPPSKKTLYPVAEKAANALEAVRVNFSENYGEAAQHAMETPARASLSKAGKILKSELRQAGLINAKGQPVAFGSREFTTEERLLLGIWDDMRGTSPNPIEGMPEAVEPGTFINYDLARRLIGRIEESTGAAKTRNTVRILASVRKPIIEGLKDSDDMLAKEIPEYGKFVGLRDVLEGALQDPDKAVGTLLNSLRDTKLDLFGKLKSLDDLAPEEFKFLNDLAQYQKQSLAAETAKKAPKTVNRLVNRLQSPQQMEKLIRSIFNQQETTIQELEALEQVSGIKFLDEFKDMAAREVFSTYKPAGFGINPVAQGQMLRAALPPILMAEKAGQVGSQFAPALPSALSFLIPRDE